MMKNMIRIFSLGVAISFSLPLSATTFQQITSVRFALNSAMISTYDKKLLNDAAKVMNNNPESMIMVIGNTDATGAKGHLDYNRKLALRRAASVKQYLLAKSKLKPAQIKSDAFVNLPTLCKSPVKSILARRVDILYCTSHRHCEQSFKSYEAWMHSHCEQPHGFFAYTPEKTQPKYAVGISYALPRAWSVSPKSITGLKFNTGQNLGDFNNDKIKSSPLIGINFAYQLLAKNKEHWFNPLWIGLSYTMTQSDLESKGVFKYNRLLPANYYNYKYNISAQALALTGKLYVYNADRIKPYVSLGIGYDKLRTSGFNLAPINNADRTTLSYPGQSKNNFYYSVALGADYSVSNYLKIGANYFYNDFGKYEIGPGKLTTHTTPAMSKRLVVDGVALTTTFTF